MNFDMKESISFMRKVTGVDLKTCKKAYLICDRDIAIAIEYLYIVCFNICSKATEEQKILYATKNAIDDNGKYKKDGILYKWFVENGYLKK